MSVLIILSGPVTQKVVELRGNVERGLYNVRPHIGCNGDECGIGIFVGDTKERGETYGVTANFPLYQAWRALKLLEEVPFIKDGTLANCWHAATENVLQSDWRHLDEFGTHFSTYGESRIVRARALALVPSRVEMCTMLDAVHEHDINIWHFELEVEHRKSRAAGVMVLDRLATVDHERWEEARIAALQNDVVPRRGIGTILRSLLR